MAKISKKTSSYSNERRLLNKKRKLEKKEIKLEKKKIWRIKKYGSLSPDKIEKKTLLLFIKLGHRTEELKEAIKNKNYKHKGKK